MKKGVLLVLLCLASWCQAALTVIELQHADAEQLLPLVAGQLGPGSSASVYQNRIVLQASEQETRIIRRLVEQLDKRGRPLLISVNITGSAGQQQDDHALRIRQSHSGQQSSTTITTSTRRIGSSAQAGGQHSLRASEGMQAFVRVGESRLYHNPDSGGQWQPADSGFYATAWVHGDQVTVSIAQQQAGFAGPERIVHQQLQSRVSGQLGEWLWVGSLDGDSTRQQAGSSRRERSSRMIYLKVDTLD